MQTNLTLAERWRNLAEATKPCPNECCQDGKVLYQSQVYARYKHTEECPDCKGAGSKPALDPKLMWQDCPGQRVHERSAIRVHTPTTKAPWGEEIRCLGCGGTGRVPTEPHLETLLAASPYVVRRPILSALKDESFHDNVLPVDYMDVAITAAEKRIKEIQRDN